MVLRLSLDKLREIRKKNDLTQAQVAELLYMSGNNFGAKETGKVNLYADELIALANLYGVSLEEFCEQEEEE